MTKPVAAIGLAAGLALGLLAVGQHNTNKCPDRCDCAETGRCGCEQCPTEMSAGLVKRAVRENRALVAFVACRSRQVGNCLVYGTPRNEAGYPSRYVVVLVPDGAGGADRTLLPPDASDEEILKVAKVPPPKPLPTMPRTR